jgi:Fe2+ transport system protein B
LANALNRSSALEAKLKASTKALGEADKKHADEVAATKLAADRAVKEAEARETKAKKALAKISKKQSQREEAVAKRIDDLLTTFGIKYRLILSSLILSLLFVCSQWLLFCDAVEQLGEVIRLCAGEAKDPLLDVVGLLESNYRNVRNVLQRT